MRKMMMAAALALATTTAPAMAQTVSFSGGLVNVPISVGDVSLLDQANFLNDNQIAALNQLVTAGNVAVQVPIGIAAQVCGVTANVLTVARDTGAPVDCANKTMTQAFANQIARQKLGGNANR